MEVRVIRYCQHCDGTHVSKLGDMLERNNTQPTLKQVGKDICKTCGAEVIIFEFLDLKEVI